jgi:predicted permease
MAGLLPRGISRAFRLPLRRSRVDDDVSDEIAFHLEMRAAELAARGWTPEAARAEARRRFGDTHHWSSAMSAVDRERVAQERRTEWLDDLAQDLRYGARSLRRAPLVSLLAVLTLALGIGANAAVFGVVKSVLLDALPYADADHLARIHTRLLDGTLERTVMSSGTVTDVVARQRSFASVGAFEGATRNVIFAGAGGPVVLKMNYAEPALFRTLGVHAALGRLIRDEDAVSDTAFNIVLTDATWRKLFAGDPSIVGKPMVVNGISRTVVGVLPRGFVGPVSDAEVYFPLNVRSTMTDAVWSRRQHWLAMIGRLRPGVTVDAARRDLAAISAGLAREYPQYNGNETTAVVPVRDDMVGDTRTPLLVLMASAAFVLVITCANLAGALLSRTISRRKEFAVRVALGAGRGRLVRQLLTESAVLAIAGGAAGLLLAWAGLHALRGLALRALPAYANLGLDRGAVLVTSLVALLTGIAFGLAPALAAGRANQEAALREEGRVASEGHRSRRLRGLLVAGQIALCVSLLAGAGLLARSLWAMTTSPIGFDAGGVLAVPVQLPARGAYAKPEARVRFFEQFEERLRALPGVTAVASSGDVPTQVGSRNGMTVEGVPRTSEAQPVVLYATVSDDYFRTLGIPLRDGRAFGPEDGLPNAPLAIIVSEGTVRRFWPNGRTVVGSRVAMGPGPNAEMATVVGVVGDVRSDPARREPEPIMYHSVRQNPFNGPIFLVRTRGGDPMALARPIQRTLAALDPSLPIHNVTTLRDVLGEQLAGRRLPVLLMTAFGTLALVLASVGVYAMFAAMAAAREREFGVRVALGASRGAIAALVLRQGGVWMLAGLAAGALGVVAVTRMVRGLLYGVSPFDPLALGAAVAMLLACGVIALLGPVRRATRVDPIMALR